jgi:hypothetical protein
MQHSLGDTLVTSLDKSPEVLRDQKFQAVIAGTPAASELFGTSRSTWIKNFMGKGQRLRRTAR